jgi:hypothetical protein
MASTCLSEHSLCWVKPTPKPPTKVPKSRRTIAHADETMAPKQR